MKRPTVKQEMEMLGFTIEQTGGGCTAYTRYAEDGSHLMITNVNDPTAPTSLQDSVTIGEYDPKGELKRQRNWENLDRFIFFETRRRKAQTH